MRSSRTPNSASSVSSISYASSKTRHRHCSSRHFDSPNKQSRKMKFIIAIGIALPIVAAIIGVVAWAVSADTAFQGPIIHSLRRSDLHMENHEEDIFQTLENRQDVEFSRQFSMPNQDLEKHDLSRFDTDENPNQFDDNNNKDPLYIVHFVPSPKPKVESSSSGPTLVSTVSNEVLEKILSASKGAKPGTPQFVVFAPVPEEEEDSKKEEVGTLAIGSQGLSMLQKKQGRNVEIDYDYEEELRKYQELLDSNDQPPHKETSRVEEQKEQIQEQTETTKESVTLTSQNFTSGSSYHSHQSQADLSNSNLLQAISNIQHQTQMPNSNIPQVISNGQHQTQIPNSNILQAISNIQNQQPQIIYQQGYSQSYPQGIAQTYPQQAVQQPQNYDPHQYYSQESKNTAQLYPQQPHATDRSGYSEPIGIKLNFGNGRGLLGGNLSPLGIIGSLLKPILPRPQLNLNGKLLFGMMLENGIKFGSNNKGPPSYS